MWVLDMGLHVVGYYVGKGLVLSVLFTNLRTPCVVEEREFTSLKGLRS